MSKKGRVLVAGAAAVIACSVQTTGLATTPTPAITVARRTAGGNCIAIGHRGNPVMFTENTLPAIESAFAVGAAMVEIDIYLTRDGVPVIIHDDDLRLTTSASGKIADMTLEQLKSVKAGSLRDETVTDSIPTLEEALLLARTRRGRVLLDIKRDGMAPTIAAIFAKHGLPQEMAAVGTWNEIQAAEYLKHMPRAQILNTQGIPANWGPDYLAAQRNRGIAAFELWWESIPEGFIEAAHAQGLLVYVYTVNDAPTMRKLIAQGVDGIETDVPEFLVHLLREHSSPH